MQKKHFLSFGLFFLLYVHPGQAFSGQDSVRSGKKNLYPLPKLSWNPEAKLVFGVMLLYVHRKSDSVFPNQVSGEFLFSQNKYIMSSVSFYQYSQRNHLGGNISYSRFPKTFYGIGSRTTKKQAETFIPQSVALTFDMNHNVHSHWFIGGIYKFNYTKLIKTERGGVFDTTIIEGENPAAVSGIGVKTYWDSRNSDLYATSGAYHQLSIIPFHRYFGSQYNFIKTTLDLRQYFSLGIAQVIASQVYLNVINGNVPFYYMSSFGGYNVTRGYQPGRYRDRNMIAFQTEIRSHLFWRIGATVFGGYGNVFRRLNELSFNDLKYSAGAGIRINLSKKETANIRMELAYGKNSFYPVISLGEAF